MKCEKCNKEHDGSFGSGRFCSRSCANSRIRTDEIKKKISNSIKTSEKFRLSVIAQLGERITKICPICKNEFEVRLSSKDQTFCSIECFRKDTNFKYHKAAKGGYRKGSDRGKGGWYKGIYCDSSWELAYVMYCIDNDIKIKRNTEKFEYYWKGDKHYYIPDFLIKGKYVEVKGQKTAQWLAKLKYFPYNIKVLYENDLQDVFEYVRAKYGNNFIELYEGNPYNLRTNKCKVCGEPAFNIYCSRKCSMEGNRIKNFN